MEKENKNHKDKQKNKENRSAKDLADQHTLNIPTDDVEQEFDEENEIGKNLGNSFNKLLGCG
ncbi:MAG: hypothetical protein CMO01_20475 [Thalassobius sp.]|nr:hypothetical protein [Thalassovita sp.]